MRKYDQFANTKEVEGVLIPSYLGSFMCDAVSELRERTISYNVFSGEALVFALLEYARHSRNTTKEERYIYLWEKAFLYDNGRDCSSLGGLEYLDSGDFIIIYSQDLPF